LLWGLGLKSRIDHTYLCRTYSFLCLLTCFVNAFLIHTTTGVTVSDPRIYRLLDASSNRAVEAVRVVEDIVRFIFNDQMMTREWKTFRHDLCSVLQVLSIDMRLAFRQADADVGASIALGSEMQRGSVAEILAANLARLQQSLRSLEEAGKLIDADAAQKIEALRYESYTLAAASQTIGVSIDRLQQVKLCVLIDGGASDQQFCRLIDMLVSASVGAIQLREKKVDDSRLMALARILVAKTRRRKTLSIINDRPDIAALAGTDGVHVGQEDLSVRDARQIVGPQSVIGVSAHSLDQLNRAVLEGANYAGIGPIFASKTKQFATHGGISLLKEVVNQTALPLFAIGGIDTKNVDTVIEAGAKRVAVAAAITAAPDPAQVVAALHQRLDFANSQAESPDENTPSR